MNMFSYTGLSPTPVGDSTPLLLTHPHAAPTKTEPVRIHPTTPHMQPLPGITHIRFSLLHVRSPLLAESLLFSPPTGTKMFHFPAYTPTPAIHSPAGNHASPWPGFPIRTPSDHRFIDNSPRLIAALHVLHRLNTPRHPPCALTNKQHKKPKQKNKKEKTPHPPHTQHTNTSVRMHDRNNARVHSTVLTQHTQHPPTHKHAQASTRPRSNTSCPRHPTMHHLSFQPVMVIHLENPTQGIYSQKQNTQKTIFRAHPHNTCRQQQNSLERR